MYLDISTVYCPGGCPLQVPRCGGQCPAAGAFWEYDLLTLQQQITEKFLTKLAGAKDIDDEKIEQLKRLLADSKGGKPKQLVKIFSMAAGGDLK